MRLPAFRGRRVDFRGRAVAVAAANKHSACVTAAGEVYTFGANNEAQLGCVGVHRGLGEWDAHGTCKHRAHLTLLSRWRFNQ